MKLYGSISNTEVDTSIIIIVMNIIIKSTSYLHALPSEHLFLGATVIKSVKYSKPEWASVLCVYSQSYTTECNPIACTQANRWHLADQGCKGLPNFKCIMLWLDTSYWGISGSQSWEWCNQITREALIFSIFWWSSIFGSRAYWL